MKKLFTRNINDWSSWGKVYQDIAAWQPLIRSIFEKENLLYREIEHLTPGTNAVFKVGSYVIKIFAPKESGIDSTTDIETETFATQHAGKLGITTSKCIACNVLDDKYRFYYMIMEFIEGKEFTKAAPDFSDEEKVAFGKNLRDITDKMNVPCTSFNDIDVIHDKGRYRRWDKYPKTFRAERLEYLDTYDFNENVFVHGDLCGDNILIANVSDISIIDFADAVIAPIIYEQALISSELFQFDKAYLHGYFGEYDDLTLTNLCFNGLLIHDFGGDIVEQHIAKPCEIISLDILRERIYTAIKSGKGYKN